MTDLNSKPEPKSGPNKGIRMGVDIGGTFTDVVLETGDQQFSTKVLTTYIAPENAIIDGSGH